MLLVSRFRGLPGVCGCGAVFLFGRRHWIRLRGAENDQEATVTEIRTYLKDQRKSVLTLLGYSAAEYKKTRRRS